MGAYINNMHVQMQYRAVHGMLQKKYSEKLCWVSSTKSLGTELGGSKFLMMVDTQLLIPKVEYFGAYSVHKWESYHLAELKGVLSVVWDSWVIDW